MLLSGTENRGWSEADSAEVENMRAKIEWARENCVKDLKDPSSKKYKPSKSNWGPWMEAGQDLMDSLQLQFPNAQLCPHFSKVHEYDFGGKTVMEPLQARHFHDLLCRGAPVGTDFLQQLPGDHYILWGSTNQDTLQRTLGTFQKFATTSKQQIN